MAKRLSIAAVVVVAGLAGIGVIGCGFVPGLGPWFDTRFCFTLGVALGAFLG